MTAAWNRDDARRRDELGALGVFFRSEVVGATDHEHGHVKTLELRLGERTPCKSVKAGAACSDVFMELGGRPVFVDVALGGPIRGREHYPQYEVDHATPDENREEANRWTRRQPFERKNRRYGRQPYRSNQHQTRELSFAARRELEAYRATHRMANDREAAQSQLSSKPQHRAAQRLGGIM